MRSVSLEEIGVINHIDDLASCEMGIVNVVDCAVEDCVIKSHATAAPRIVTLRGRSFVWRAKTGSSISGFATQLIADPPTMAPIVKMMTGVVIARSSFAVAWMGLAFDGHQEEEIMKRVEYAAVAPVARKNIRTKIEL